MRRSTRSPAVIACAIALAGAAACGTSGPAAGAPPSDPAVVTTDRGPVRGTVTGEHRSFQGIPYAAAPTGELRWRPPRPAARWTTPRDSARPGPLCAQNGRELGRPSNSENCLSLNVTTPRNTGAGQLPVVVWVHGGSFKDGGGSLYGARRMAAAGRVVVVTINYRLGAFGFLAHPALDGASGSGNFGFQDQQAALRWVRRNAAAFGGDPGNVTLAGESGGGTAVCGHLAAPGSAGLFHRAILQSNDCTTTWSPEASSAPRDRSVARRQGRAVATALGCTDPARAAECLRAAPVSAVREASGDGDGVGPVFGTPVLPVDPARALADGRTRSVPVLHGINADEERFRVYGTELANGPTTLADYRGELRRLFGADAAAVAREYPCTTDTCAATTLSAVLTDARYAAPAVANARLFARRAPTYTYEFADEHAPWFRDLPAARFAQGAYHTAELPYLFDVSWREQLSPEQERLADTMIGYWTRFARTGDPNGSGAPRWEPFTRSNQYVQSLAPGSRGIRRAADFQDAHRVAFWTSLAR